MYKTILMPLDGTPTDRAIIEHIKQLANDPPQPRRGVPRGDQRRRPMARSGRGR